MGRGGACGEGEVCCAVEEGAAGGVMVVGVVVIFGIGGLSFIEASGFDVFGVPDCGGVSFWK